MPSPVDLLDPGIELGFPALQVDSLPTELLAEDQGTKILKAVQHGKKKAFAERKRGWYVNR